MSYLLPTDFVTKMLDAGASKVHMSTRDTLIRSYMAGAILALAAVFAITIAVQTGSALLGAVLFPVGFSMLYLMGFDLLTGVFMLTPLALLDKRPGVTVRGILRNWGLVFCGLAFGVLLALSKTVEAYCAPLFHTLRQIPSIALIPMFVLLFGIDETFKIIIVAKTAFFPVALAASEGVKAIPRSYFEVADVYRLRWPTLVREIALPAAAPPIISGFRISLTRAWVVLVATELLAADSGLGQMIEMSRQMLRIDVVMVGVVVTGVIGFALDFSFRRLEQHLFRWQTR